MTLPKNARALLCRRWCAIAVATVSGLLIACPASSQWKDWDYDLDQEKKSWDELQTKLPPYPKPENLLKFDMGPVPNSYFIDSASLSIGDDGVVRYTLMIKTGGGATNVSFEGIRCESREFKIYAFGHPDAQWSRARDPHWRRIEVKDIHNHHSTLHLEHFCPARKWAAPLKQITQTLKYGASRRTVTD